jgi:hypothetical protein
MPTREDRRAIRRGEHYKQATSLTDAFVETHSSGLRLSQTQRRVAKHMSLRMIDVCNMLSHRITLGFVNLITLCYLLKSSVSIFHGDNGFLGRNDLIASLIDCAGGKCDGDAGSLVAGNLANYLSYPADVAMQARTHRLPPASASERLIHHAGYWEVRPGTFRSRYPSVAIDDTFDEVYAITNPKCPGQWEEFARRARHAGLGSLQWPMPPFKHISISQPPMPILASAFIDANTGNKAVISILKRQLAYLQAHRAIWEYVLSTGRQRVLIVDESVFPTERLLRILPSLFNQIDQESLAMQTSWHMVTFRRKPAVPAFKANSNDKTREAEAVWCSSPKYGHSVVRSRPSFGSGMYALSSDGARWLLEHVTSYRAPMDVELALLQQENPDEFVVLSACNNDDESDFCPEVAMDIGVQSSRQNQFECVWRRLHERRLTSL